jgi:hypothetical protein
MNREKKGQPQGLLPYEVEVVDDGAVTGRAGLPLVLETMKALGMSRVINTQLQLRQRDSGFDEAQMVEAVVLLMASGGEVIDDIEVLRADQGLCRLLDRKLPAADTVRRFLYEFHDDQLIKEAQASRKEGQIAYIPKENDALRALGECGEELVKRVTVKRKSKKATLDLDATIQESHKKEALPHYKGGRGYQPSVIYWAEEDLVVADEYRDGNVPAGMANLPLIKRGFGALPEVTERYFRGDSACYDETVLKWLSADERLEGPRGTIGFTISADMSPQLRQVCQGVSKWEALEDRPAETVYWAEVEFVPGDWPKKAAPLRYLAIKIEKKQLSLLSDGSEEERVKYLAIVSNRWEMKGEALIKWHWKKAGTIELVHDVTKNELGSSVPPCGRFGANAAWFRLSLLTYNVLSAMKSLVLPPHLSTARPKRLRFAVFTLAGRLVSHAGQLVLRVGQRAAELAGLLGARSRLALLAQSLAGS